MYFSKIQLYTLYSMLFNSESTTMHRIFYDRLSDKDIDVLHHRPSIDLGLVLKMIIH